MEQSACSLGQAWIVSIAPILKQQNKNLPNLLEVDLFMHPVVLLYKEPIFRSADHVKNKISTKTKSRNIRIYYKFYFVQIACY